MGSENFHVIQHHSRPPLSIFSEGIFGWLVHLASSAVLGQTSTSLAFG
jgi:hypothetical protein